MTDQLIPGDVTVRTVSIFTDRGVINATEHVSTISIYESIFQPGIYVEMTVWDTMNVATELNLRGGERLNIEVQTPGREPLIRDFVLVGMKDGVVSANARSRAYTLYGFSKEVVNNRIKQVSKSYNTNISAMVQDIFKTFLGSPKNISVETTRGIQRYVVPNLQPFEAIDLLRMRAASISNASSSFVFFENKDGFVFKTIEDLMTSGSVDDRVFTYDTTINTDIRNSIFRNIISYSQPQQFDLIDRLNSSGFAHQVRSFDFRTLEFTDRVETFKPGQYKNADGILQNPDSSDVNRSYSKTAGNNTWVSLDSGSPTTYQRDTVSHKKHMAALYNQSSVLVHVFGDSEMSAGQLVRLDIPDNTSATMAPSEHRMISGNYLISNIHHMIDQEGVNPRYTCSMDCIKGGYRNV